MPQQRCAGGVSFTLTRRRVKNLNLRVRADGSVAVSAPSSMPVGVIDAFVARRAAWVLRTQDRFARRRAAEAAQPPPDQGEALAGMRALCEAWWPYFAGRCPGPMPAVRVRDMHTRWGSCSLRTRTSALSAPSPPGAPPLCLGPPCSGPVRPPPGNMWPSMNCVTCCTRTTPPPSGRRSPVCCPTTPRGAPCCAPERPDREGTSCPTTNDIPR